MLIVGMAHLAPLPGKVANKIYCCKDKQNKGGSDK